MLTTGDCGDIDPRNAHHATTITETMLHALLAITGRHSCEHTHESLRATGGTPNVVTRRLINVRFGSLAELNDTPKTAV
jgi:hypothetical protein